MHDAQGFGHDMRLSIGRYSIAAVTPAMKWVDSPVR